MVTVTPEDEEGKLVPLMEISVPGVPPGVT
jgi:hypothetical protein